MSDASELYHRAAITGIGVMILARQMPMMRVAGSRRDVADDALSSRHDCRHAVGETALFALGNMLVDAR